MSSVKIKLETGDKSVFRVPVEVAKTSLLIKNMLEACGEGNLEAEGPVPIDKVTGPVLKKIMDWAEYQQKNVGNMKAIRAYNESFLKMDLAVLFDLIRAVNFLDIEPLVDLTTQALADLLKQKKPEEIRKLFDLP